MLRLPTNWNSITAGAVAAYLFNQLGSLPLQTEFARTMVGNSLELMLKAIAHAREHQLHVEAAGYLEWRIRDAIYAYQPAIDNNSMNACAELGMRTTMFTVIVPAGIEVAMRRCLDCVLGMRSPPVYTFPDFVSHRTIFASLDADWTHDETLLTLLGQFNKSIADAKLDNSLLVDIPNNSDLVAEMP